MAIFICLFEPKKSALKNGAVSLVIPLDAPNKKVAEAMAIGKLWEAYPAAGDNFIAPKICEDTVGSPRPPVGEFSETFAQENHFDGTQWLPNPAVQSGPVPFHELPVKIRIAGVLLHGLRDMDEHDHSLAHDFLDDDESDPGLLAVIEALSGIEPVKHMAQDAIKRLTDDIHAKYPRQLPPAVAIARFAKEWINASPGDRDQLVGGSKAAQTASVTTTGAAQQYRPRDYPHDYKSLDREIATALLFYGNDPFDVGTRLVRDADKAIEEGDEAWRKWSTELRVRTDALQIPREVIFGLIRAGRDRLELLSDADARKDFVTCYLADAMGKPDVQVQNLGDGKFTVDGLMGTDAPAANSHVSDDTARQAKEALDQLGYGVYAAEPEEQKSELLQRAESNAVNAVELVEQIKADDFQQRAVQVEQMLADQSQEACDNLSIWNRVYKTDSKFTKAFSHNGGGTSINGTYMVLQATKAFGPQGVHWGVEIVEERYDDGAPIMQTVKRQDGSSVKEVIPNGNGGYLCEVNHTVRINLWFKDGERTAVIPAYGCTPYISATSKGAMSDGEAPKKSLTDATKKALSQLGFSADVFLGLYDDVNYRQENATEFAIKNASDKAGAAIRLRQDLDEKIEKNIKAIEGAVSANEAKGVYSVITREVDVYRKDAQSKADTDFDDYLKKRLISLHRATEKRVAELEEAKGEKA